MFQVYFIWDRVSLHILGWPGTPTDLSVSASAVLGLNVLFHYTYSEINLRLIYISFAFMYVCAPHIYKMPIKPEETIRCPKTEWVALCVPETKPKSLEKQQVFQPPN